MKKVSKFLLVTILCLLFGGVTVSAADERLGTVVEGSLLTDGTEARYEVSPLARGAFLSSGSGGVFIQGSRYLRLEGNTTCYRAVDELNVSLQLQRLEGNSWVYVSELPTRTAYDTYYVSKSGYRTVEGGYYYRVYGGHVAKDNGAMETVTSCSNGLWVD